MARARSPVYPNFSLRQAVQRAEKIFIADRRNAIDRDVAAKHMGYGNPSGASDKSLATMQHFRLLERVGKGELRVAQLAIDILHPDNPSQRKRALFEAAFSPQLFKSLKARFPDGVSSEALKSYLVRENFLDRAIIPITTAYTDTCEFLKQEGAYEFGEATESEGAESRLLDDEFGGSASEGTYGGAQVGDFIQWESNGELKFERPKRVRLVSMDGQFVAVDGSTTGIPMSQVIVEELAQPQHAQPPMFPLGIGEITHGEVGPGESEWMRNRLGGGTGIRLLVTGEMGPKQIGRLIKLLEAQRAVLEDDDNDLLG